MKKLFIVLGVLVLLFFLIPEKEFKQAQKGSVKYVAAEYEINPKAANFLLNTKLGRKVAYIYLRKRTKKGLKEQDDL